MISAENLCKSFGDHEVLKNINFNINKGSVVSIIGPSGSGKTTLLRILHGLETFDKGTLNIDGKTGFVFQNFNLFAHMTVLENLTYTPINVQGRSRNVVEHDALELLSCIGLLDFKDRYPKNLSGGQKQRIAIARTLMTQPDILLMDEPTASLDPSNKMLVIKLIEALHENGKTIICISHDPEFVSRFDILEVNNGVIVGFKKHD